MQSDEESAFRLRSRGASKCEEKNSQPSGDRQPTGSGSSTRAPMTWGALIKSIKPAASVERSRPLRRKRTRREREVRSNGDVINSRASRINEDVYCAAFGRRENSTVSLRPAPVVRNFRQLFTVSRNEMVLNGTGRRRVRRCEEGKPHKHRWRIRPQV